MGEEMRETTNVLCRPSQVVPRSPAYRNFAFKKLLFQHFRHFRHISALAPRRILPARLHFLTTPEHRHTLEALPGLAGIRLGRAPHHSPQFIDNNEENM